MLLRSLSAVALFFALTTSSPALEFPQSTGLDAASLPGLSQSDGPAALAADRFRERIAKLGSGNTSGARAAIRAGHLNDGELKRHFTRDKLAALTRDLKPWQRDQAYAIAIVKEDGRDTILAGGLTELGTTYAISELEIRLRVRNNGEVYLDFPEWADESSARELFDFPAIEERGEYMNIGYNIPGITPHEWGPERWKAYIDKIVLAKLNRFYFYIWIDTYSMNPASALSQHPLTQAIHENLKGMIAYAQGRGLEVLYMFCPTFFPKDLWNANPAIHAEITYVDHGFPAVCPNAPGAWDLMLANARSEFAWFAGADAIQIWFYDPGGCWCEKNGCASDQPGAIAKQFKVFGDLFREYNPKAKLEYNFWPVWVWEDIKKIQYRDDINAGIKEQFSGNIAAITAVGGDNGGISFPVREKALGFRSATFLFGTNPESGYAFLIPHLRWTPALIKEAKATDLNGAFGHRLEAWTRYPATFFMGESLWDPESEPREAVRRWAAWQCARNEPGAQLATVIELLEQYTDDKPTAELGNQMSQTIDTLWPELPAAAKEDLEYVPAMFDCFRIIGDSLATEDPEQLADLANQFTEALRQSPTFAPLEGQGSHLFTRYRELLKPGWRKAPF